jgi:uncharacterized protein (TIGR02646 family)
LQARLGDYCSYCERQIETNLAVEHIQPKSTNPDLETDWDNFLLGCVNCNSSKGDSPVIVADYLWPDVDNTLNAFEYVEGGLVQPHSNLPAALRQKAQALLELVGLDKYPGHPQRARRPTDVDKRWNRRRDARKKALYYAAQLAAEDSPALRQAIVDLIIASGHFSIWWFAFSTDTDMRRRMRQAFPGTAAVCFDAGEEPVPRGQT